MNLKNFLILLLFIITNLSYSQYSSTLLGRYIDGRDGACEISAYDSTTAQLFITNSESDSIDIVSIQNPQAPALIGGVDVTLYGGGVNSLVNIGNGYIAAAIEDTNAQAPGKVVFFDINGLYINEVTVGVLPDMITVTEDKSKVITANEGEPNDDYDVDPLGSVSVIDISGGITNVTQADVTTLDFTSYNGQESALRAQGALIFGKKQQKTFNTTLLGRYTDGRDGACEISAYDSTTAQLFITNSESDSIDIVSIQNPQAPALIGGVDVTLYGGGVNSLVNIGNGYIAAAIEDTNAQAPGKVVFFDINGLYINEVTVGVLPDMITVTEDKSKVITANEGEPNDDYDVDPLGSVSVIDISGGITNVTQADVTTLDFTSYNGQESALRAQGALIFGKQPIATPTDLFFSEYSEGSSSNKYIEIYNGTGSSVDLSNYVIMQNSNGGPWDEYTDVLSGTLADGDVYVIANSSASPSILAEADLTGSGICFFNGDDARALIKVIGTDTTICDFIGDFPNDPGSGWNVAGVTNGTQNHTLVRKNWVNKGNDNWSLSAGSNVFDSEWIVYPQDSIVSLGSHSLVSTKHSSVAEDLEPEYVTTDENSATAYVVCQENNAIAIIDLTTLTLDTIVGLGFKDFNLPGNGFDASNQDNGINIQNWPVKGAYQPDAIDYYSVNNTSYLVTANEGDARDYDGYSAEVRMDDLTFDPTAFPNAVTLQTNDNLGRLKTFTEDVIGDTDGDGDVDELYAYGARSFSIWDQDGNLVWDSGDDFEQYIAANHPTFFNCNDGLASEMDDRSDDKGPEPEAVTVGQIGNSYYAFIGLERQGGVMVYDVTDPTTPSFVNFIETYDTTSGTMTDIAPEGLVFVPADESHNGENLLIVSSEVSGTVAIYEIGAQDFIPSSVAEDLEPEYVTTDENSATAYVVCQENNAIAIIDLTTLTLDTIVGLGFKDFNLPGNGFDASNQDNGINIQNWPVKGAYQPDAIDYYSVNNTSYLVTANEGDARDYDGYSAEVRMDDLTFDPTAFPNAVTLQTNDNLGRLKTFTEDVIGDTDGDGDVDELYAYGARSFSIWDQDGNLVWDSGDDFEQYIAANHPTFFNCNDGLASEMDDRSDDKGPEPEAVTVGQIGNSYYAFIGLERQGGVMVYDVTDPTTPSFVNFIETYDTTSGTMTDIAPEGLVFVPADESHNGENLLIVSSEVSGTVAIYELQDCISSSAVTDSSCNSYLWNNIVYSNSGVYSDTLSNSFGCDSIITLDLTIFNISAAIDTISGNLVASGGVNYLWNTGETASSITPDTNGLYTVIVTDINGCTDTVSFNVTFISNTGIVGLNNNFRLYPNPNNGQFVIECQEKIESIILYNIQGQIVRSFTRINSKQFTINESFNEKGIFFVNISTQNKSFIEKVVINK